MIKETVYDKIRGWAGKRNLINGSDSTKQMLKLTEEVGEIAAAVARNNRSEVIDGIGDAVVVLTILASQHNMYIEDCVDVAYETIKDRKGKMVDGVFIKEEDTV